MYYIQVFSLFLYNFEGYLLVQAGTPCSNVGLDLVNNVDECRNQVELIKNAYRNIDTDVREENVSGHPKGCYVCDFFDSCDLELYMHFGIFFNHHSSGRQDKKSRQLCADYSYYIR